MTSETEDHLQRVAERWDATAEARLASPIHGWMDSSIVLEDCVLPKLGGGPGRHWLAAAVDRHAIPKQAHWLSLGCGSAGTEIAASRNLNFLRRSTGKGRQAAQAGQERNP